MSVVQSGGLRMEIGVLYLSRAMLVLAELIVCSYQSLCSLKTCNLSEATNFHIRAFHLPTSCHMMQFKGVERQKLALNWPQTGN